MKITINESVSKEIELPLYFKSKKYDYLYFMLIGELSAIEVVDFEVEEKLGLLPAIRIVEINHKEHCLNGGIEPISETEFKHVYTKVSLRIEKLLN